MPVRYAVAPIAVNPAVPGWASGHRVIDVPLGSEFHYTLRTMRAGFIYLFYSKHSRGTNYWECYSVGQDGTIILQPSPKMAQPQATPDFSCCRSGHNPLGVHYFVIEQPKKCGTAWIAYSETKWSDETLKEYTDNSSLRDARMQTISPAIMASGTKHSHGALADVSGIEGVLEYSPTFSEDSFPHDRNVSALSQEDGSYAANLLTKVSTRYPWHLRKGKAEATVKHMKVRGKSPNGDLPPHVLALWDGIGIAHELNGFQNDAAGWIKRYGDERELQISAAHAIEGTKQALDRNIENGWDDRATRVSKLPDVQESGMRTRAVMLYAKGDPVKLGAPLAKLDEQYNAGKLDEATYKAQRSSVIAANSKDPAAMEAEYAKIDQYRKDLAEKRAKSLDKNKQRDKSEAWSKYEAKLDGKALAKFKQQWSAMLEDADKILDRRAEVLIKWLEAPLFIDTLEDCHPSNIQDGVIFEDAVGEAILGIGSSKNGRKKLDKWIKEAKASVKSNLLWRAFALNQKDGIADIDAALRTALTETAPLTQTAWNAALSNLKNLQKLADTYKKAQGVYDGNLKASGSSGSSAFGVRLKPINTRGFDRITMTAGDAIYRAFRINKVGDFVSEKIIQHIFCLRAYVDPVDSLRLVAAQAKEQKLANADILRRMRTAKAFLGFDPPEGVHEGRVDVSRSQQAASLAEAWESVKKNSSKGPAAIKDARLAVVVMLIETANFAKLIDESKGDNKAYATIAASGMSITAATIDIAGVAAKNIWGNEAATYQKLKLLGGLLGGAASIVGAGVDAANSAEQYEKGRWNLVVLYGMKSASSFAGGLLAGTTAFTYGAGVIYKITGRAALAQAARATSTVAVEIIAARIFMMSVGAWITVITVGLQVLIWKFTPNALEDWCEGCTFGPKAKRKGWNPKQQLDEFDKAIVEVL